MKRLVRSLSRRKFLTLAAGSAVMSHACAKSSASAPLFPLGKPAAKFTVYDHLIYLKRPSIDVMQPIAMAGNDVWQGSDRSVPYEPACRRAARNAAKKGLFKLVLDIEHWPTNYAISSKPEVEETMRKIIQIMTWMRSEVPKLELGVYGFPPLREYWTPVRAKSLRELNTWRSLNEFLRPLADEADFITPSLYTFYEDVPGWITYASANIIEAQRFGKPVFPFLWPRYHLSNAKLKVDFIPGRFWATQLQTVRNSGVQGVVLWDWDATTRSATKGVLDPSLEWWQETVKFTQRLT
jgi:hypothetical protein